MSLIKGTNMKLTTVTALLAGLIVGILVVIGVFSLLPELGVGTPPTLEPTAAASTAASVNTCSYENMPMAPVLPASITEPGSYGKSLWVSKGKPYFCISHTNNFNSTGCPMAMIVAQDEDGDFTTYAFMYNSPVVGVIHIPRSAVNTEGFTHAMAQYTHKQKIRSLGGIPTSASDLLYVLTEGVPLDKTSCKDMK
jgi:hypothetical protein